MMRTDSFHPAVSPVVPVSATEAPKQTGPPSGGKPSLSLPSAIFQREVATRVNVTSQAATSIDSTLQHDVRRASQPEAKMASLLSTLDDTMQFTQKIRNTFGDFTENLTFASLYRQDGHVWFNSPLNSAVDITPYSQIYGMHPKFFNFDAEGAMEVSSCADEWRCQHARSPTASPHGAAGSFRFFGPGGIPLDGVQTPVLAAMPSAHYCTAAGHTPMAGQNHLSRGPSFGNLTGAPHTPYSFGFNLLSGSVSPISQVALNAPGTPCNATPGGYTSRTAGSTPFRVQSGTPQNVEPRHSFGTTAGLNFGSLSAGRAASADLAAAAANAAVMHTGTHIPGRVSFSSSGGGAVQASC